MIKKHYLTLALLVVLSACTGGSDKPPYAGVKIGKPYQIYGRWYKPQYEPNYDEVGMASWYGPGFHGNKTANGEVYDQHGLTAAHRTLPLPSVVRVTNLENGKSAIIRVNDRGPFAKDRILDLSRASADKLGVIASGTAKVRVQFLDDLTKQYVQSSNEKGIQYAMNELQGIVPAEASALQDLRSKPQFYVMKVEKGQPVPPDSVVVSEADADRYPTRNLFEEAEPLMAKNDAPAARNSRIMATPGSYYVQAGTFGVEGNARKLASKIERDYNARIVRMMAGDKALYRVMIGPYAESDHAESAASNLNKIGVADARVIRD